MDITSFVLGMKVGKNSGGGSSADVRYVTFMNGDEELYVKPVAVGDDCVDVFTKGLISKPTKESTVAEAYTYSGWSIADDGTVDSDALKAVTEDRTVYACYNSTVRKYNVSFYDGDTLLTTLSVAYGSTPAYTTEKDGFSFNGWSPEIVPVTGDAVYYAQWIEAITFAGASWADIARISESGEAKNYFAVGDTRIEVIGGTEVTLAIADFDYDVDENGNTVGMTIVTKTIYPTEKYMVNYGFKQPWTYTNIYSKVNDVLTKMSNELQAVIKPVNKKYQSAETKSKILSTNVKLWALSLGEVCDNVQASGILTERSQDRPYTLFQTDNDVACTDSSIEAYWLRSMSDGKYDYWLYQLIIGIKNVNYHYASNTNNRIGTRFGFCV